MKTQKTFLFRRLIFPSVRQFRPSVGSHIKYEILIDKFANVL